MTAQVITIGATPSIEMYWNGPIATYEVTGGMWTWFRSLNTQEWLGPFPLVDGATFISNDRYTKWFADTSSIPGFGEQHRNGFYQFCTTPPFGPTDKPTIGIGKQGLIRLIFQPGGETGAESYISNNEQREADTYFRPNY
jgi:hypothetical protein